VISRRRCKTQAEARMAIFEWHEGWCNPHPRHSSLGYLSPINYERRLLTNEAAAIWITTRPRTGAVQRKWGRRWGRGTTAPPHLKQPQQPIAHLTAVGTVDHLSEAWRARTQKGQRQVLRAACPVNPWGTSLVRN
jgi:hypothetical protein